MGHKIQVYS